MRISDWSSDVCSSDLFQRGQIPTFNDQSLPSLAEAGGWVALSASPLLGDNPLLGAEVIRGGDGQQLAVLAQGASLSQVFGERFSQYAVAVFVLMLAMLRSEEHTSELQSLMRISYAVFCLKKKQLLINHNTIL